MKLCFRHCVSSLTTSPALQKRMHTPGRSVRAHRASLSCPPLRSKHQDLVLYLSRVASMLARLRGAGTGDQSAAWADPACRAVPGAGWRCFRGAEEPQHGGCGASGAGPPDHPPSRRAPSALFLLLPRGQGGRCNCCSEPQPYSNLISSFMSSNIVAVMHVQVSVQLRTKQLLTKMPSNASIIGCPRECCPVTASEST